MLSLIDRAALVDVLVKDRRSYPIPARKQPNFLLTEPTESTACPVDRVGIALKLLGDKDLEKARS